MGRGKDWERKSVIKALDGGKESIGWRDDVGHGSRSASRGMSGA